MSTADMISYHIRFLPPSPTKSFVDEEPHATEVIVACFPPTCSTEDQRQFVDGMEKLVLTSTMCAPGCKSGAGGWAGEKVQITKALDQGLVYVLLNALTSVEAHLKFRETKEFEKNIHWPRYATDRKALEVFHIKIVESRA